MSTPPSTGAAPAATKPAPRHVLYADDFQELHHLMRITLAGAGYAVTCVPDGTSAWTEIQQRPGHYDLLITDHHMPRMGGLELVQRLRAAGYAGKIIVTSSELSERADLEYETLGVDLVLKKPMKFVRLPELIRTLLPESAARLNHDGGLAEMA